MFHHVPEFYSDEGDSAEHAEGDVPRIFAWRYQQLDTTKVACFLNFFILLVLFH